MPRLSLEEPDRLAVLVDVDREGRGLGAETGHLEHVATERYEHARSRVDPDVADGDDESLGAVAQQRIVRGGGGCLRHADREVCEPLPLVAGDRLEGSRGEIDPVRAVDRG